MSRGTGEPRAKALLLDVIPTPTIEPHLGQKPCDVDFYESIIILYISDFQYNMYISDFQYHIRAHDIMLDHLYNYSCDLKTDLLLL